MYPRPVEMLLPKMDEVMSWFVCRTLVLMFEATKDDVKSCWNVETVSVGKGFTRLAKLTPLMLDMNETAVESDVVEIAPAVIVPLEIASVEIAPAVIVPLEIVPTDKKGSVVGDTPNASTLIPFIDEMNETAVDRVLVETAPDVVTPVVFVVVAFTVAAAAVPVTVREFADAAPDTTRDPIPAAVVTVRVPVTVLLGVYNEPP